MSQSQLVAYGVCVTYRADSILSWRKGKQGRLGILSACACVFFSFSSIGHSSCCRARLLCHCVCVVVYPECWYMDYLLCM